MVIYILYMKFLHNLISNSVDATEGDRPQIVIETKHIGTGTAADGSAVLAGASGASLYLPQGKGDTMTTSLIFDIAIAAILLLCLIVGGVRGFISSVLSVAVFAAALLGSAINRAMQPRLSIAQLCWLAS